MRNKQRTFEDIYNDMRTEGILSNRCKSKKFEDINVNDTIEILYRDGIHAKHRAKKYKGKIVQKTKQLIVMQLENYKKSFSRRDFMQCTLKFRIMEGA